MCIRDRTGNVYTREEASDNVDLAVNKVMKLNNDYIAAIRDKSSARRSDLTLMRKELNEQLTKSSSQEVKIQNLSYDLAQQKHYISLIRDAVDTLVAVGRIKPDDQLVKLSKL